MAECFTLSDCDSSDDELLTSANKFTALFQQIGRQAARSVPTTSTATADVTIINDIKSKTSSSSGRDNLQKEQEISSGGDVKKAAPENKRQSIDISDDTRNLFDQLDSHLHIPAVDFVVKHLADARKNPPPVVDPPPAEASGSRGRGRGRGRGKRGGGRGRGRGSKRRKWEDPEEEAYRKIIAVEVADVEIGDVSLNGTLNFDNEVIEVNSQSSAVTIDLGAELDYDEQEEALIAVRWKSSYFRFRLPKGKRVTHLRMNVAEKIGLRPDDIIICDEEEDVEVSDMLKLGDLPEMRVLYAQERSATIIKDDSSSSSQSQSQQSQTTKPTTQRSKKPPKKVTRDPDAIEVKVQGGGGHRERHSVFIKKTTQIKQVLNDYVAKYKLEGKRLKLVFDGDDVDLSETPESLDLESGDLVEVVEV